MHKCLTLALVLTLTGCAERVYLNTAPSGAHVSVNGRDMGVTPLPLRIPRGEVRDRLPVLFTHDGYQPLTHELRAHVTVGRIMAYVATSGIMAAFKGPFSFEKVPQAIVLEPLPVQ